MKKLLLPLVLISLFAMPFFSTSALATGGDLVDYDTGVKVAGTESTVRISWEMTGCVYIMTRANVDIDYRHTTPKSAVPGGFDLSGMTIGGYFEENPSDPDAGTWYGYVEFTSYIHPDAKRGTNHGDITIYWSPAYPEVSWSFNVLHRA